MRSQSLAKRPIWARAGRTTILDRPLVEVEWDVVRAFVRRMERDDLRLRFGSPRDFRDEVILRQSFDIEAGGGEMAWVLDDAAAIAGMSHRIKVSRSQAEIALIVRSDLKRLGIGEFLLWQMVARARRQGLGALTGLVLWENRAMRRLAAKVGAVPRQVGASTMELTLEIGLATAVA